MRGARSTSKAPRGADPWNVFGGGTPATTSHILPDPAAFPPPEKLERRDPLSSPRIGEILVGAGVITVEARDRVLEYQEWNHVSFGTALIESGALPESLFLRALSVQLSVPAATAEDLESAPPAIVALLKPRVADRLSVLPLRKVGRTLHLAMVRPTDRSAIRSVELLTGLTVVPHVAVAFRVALALERHYGVPAAAHYRAVAEALSARPAPAASPAPAAASPEAARPLPDPPRPAPGHEPRPRPPLPWSRLLEELAGAGSPDELAEALLDFLGDAAGRSALYLSRGEEAVLWRSWPAASHTRARALPYSAASILATLRGSNDVFTGPCPDTEANREVLAAVGERFPADLFVVPVNLNRKTVLWIVGRSDRGAPPLDRPSLRRLARIAATALGLVALKRRLLSV